jgi:rare lipoprotein A (peptidoglycan hydrolase)
MSVKLLVSGVAAAAIGAAAAGMAPVAMASIGQAGIQMEPIHAGMYAQTPESDGNSAEETDPGYSSDPGPGGPVASTRITVKDREALKNERETAAAKQVREENPGKYSDFSLPDNP